MLTLRTPPRERRSDSTGDRRRGVSRESGIVAGAAPSRESDYDTILGQEPRQPRARASATSTTSGCWPRHITRARSRHVLDRDALRVDERDARRPQHVRDGRVVAGELIRMREADRIIINHKSPAQP